MYRQVVTFWPGYPNAKENLAVAEKLLKAAEGAP
jgi:hypothetical protein